MSVLCFLLGMLKVAAIRQGEQSFLLRSNYELPLWSGLKRVAHNLAESSVPGIPFLQLNTIKDGEEDTTLSKVQYPKEKWTSSQQACI